MVGVGGEGLRNEAARIQLELGALTGHVATQEKRNEYQK